MAALPSQLTTCDICFESYSSTIPERAPLCLPCAHTVCFSCCTGMIKEQKIVCPTCRKSSNANSAKDVPRNLTIIAILDAESQSQAFSSLADEDIPRLELPVKDENCVNHGDGCPRKANIYCATCNGSFCQQCADAIHQTSFMKSHKLGPMSGRQVRCPFHSEMICDLVVIGTKHIICLKCHQYGKFRNKRVRPIEEVSAEVVGKLKKQRCVVSSISDDLKSQQSKLTKDLQNVRHNAAACREQVDNAFQLIEAMFAKRKSRLLHQVEMFEQTQVHAAEERLQDIQKTTTTVLELEERMKALASGDSDNVTLVSSFSDLEAQLKAQEVSAHKLLNQPCLLVMQLRQDLDSLRKQVSTFVSLGTTLEAITFKEEKAKKLADEGIIDSITNDHTPLTEAAESNNVNMVKALIKFGADVNATDIMGRVPLHYASYSSFIEVAKILLAVKGIDVNAKNEYGVTPLHKACERNDIEVIKLLLAAEGIDVNAHDIDDDTPLHIATIRAHAEVVKLLLSVESIDVNAQNNDGETALAIAIELNNDEVVHLLLNAGAQ